MNTLSRFIEPLGWTLLHFLWQGAAVALLLAVFLRLARRSAPQVRYVASGAALVLMLVAAAGTVWWQMGPGDIGDRAHRPYMPYTAYKPAGTGVPVMPVKEPAGEGKEITVPLNAAAPPETPPDAAALPAPVSPAPALVTTADRLRPFLPWLVAVWAAGVAVFSLRLVNGWRLVRRWRAAGNTGLPEEWCTRFTSLCARMRLSRPVQLLSSAVLTVPVVIGWLKPVVLVPAGLFSGISAAQLEAILAHELAHVRRHDYLINLLQTIVETVLFYHPAVWWVSARLRVEREHCCDDIAASLDGDALGYARALATLEELRAVPAAGLSAAGGSLFQRIRRLAGLPEQRTAGIAWPLGILTFSVMAVVLPWTLLHAAEPGFTPPRAAHISSGRLSAYCVHDGKETDFILLSGISFNSSSTSGANSKLRTWHDDGKIIWDPAGEVTFSRTSERPGTLSLTYSPDAKALPVTAVYELSKGRVFILIPGIAPQQVALDTPPVSSPEKLETLYNDVAAKLEADARRAIENAGPVKLAPMTLSAVTVGPAITIGSDFPPAAAKVLLKNGSNLGVFDLTFPNPVTREIDENPQLDLRYPDTPPFEPANARDMVKSALNDNSGLKLWDAALEKSPSRMLGMREFAPASADPGLGLRFQLPVIGPVKLDYGIPYKAGGDSFTFVKADVTPFEAGAPRTPANEELTRMAFGETHASGLRVAWVLSPPAPSHLALYPVGSILNCRVVFHNNGKKPVKFRTDSWHQHDQWIVKNAAGQEVKVKTVWYTGITPFKDITLKPGEICEVPAHGVGIGEGLYEEAYSTGKIGAEIPAKAGDVLTCQWVVELAGGRPDPNWTPPPDSPPATLTTGAVKITVGVADAAAKTAVGVAGGTGKYELADGIKMQVSQITTPGADGKDSYNNLATIEWYDANGTKTLEWPIQLSAGKLIDPIVWRRGGAAIWIVHGLVVRKIDYTNATDLKETVIKMDEANRAEDAPRDVLQQIVRIVRADMKRFETELEISVPAAEAAKKDAIVVSVAKSGAAKLSGETVTDQQLTAKLAEIAKTRPDQVVIIEAEKETPATEAHRVMQAVGKSGLTKIAFRATEAAEKKPPPAPGAEVPGNSLATRSKAEMIINVRADGSIVWDEKTLTTEELAQKLSEIANVNKKQAIVIRGDVSTPYEKIVAVLDATHKAGLFHVSFATTKPEAAAPAPAKEPPAPPAVKPDEPSLLDGPASGPSKKTDAAGELKIVVSADGALKFNDSPVTRDELRGKLTEAAKAEKKPSVSIQAESETEFKKISELLELVRGAGLTDIKFSAAETADPKQAAAEKALKEIAATMAAGKDGEARTKLLHIQKLLGERHGKDFRGYYLILLADVHMALAKLDVGQAMRAAETDKAAAQKLFQEAIGHFSDGLGSLIAFDKDYDKSSVACRTRMGRGYLEFGRLFVLSDALLGGNDGFARDATVAFREAVKIFMELREEEPKNVDHTLNLISCYNEVAALIASSGVDKNAAREALGYQTFSVEMLRRLSGERPDGRLSMGPLLAEALLQHADLLLTAEDKAGALKSSQEALDLTTALLAQMDVSADTWKKCASLQSRAKALVIVLKNGKPGTIPPGPASNRRVKLRSLTIPKLTSVKMEEEQLRLAHELRTNIAAGADFAVLAKTHSADSKQEKGGDWGWVSQDDLNQEFWPIVEKLKNGETSEVISIRQSYYIFRVEDDDEAVFKRLGQVKKLLALGEYAKAQAICEEALKLDPDNAAAKKAREEISARQGQPQEPGGAVKPKETVDADPGIALTVTDSTGKVPMPEFRVIAGVRSQAGGNKDTINWQPHTLRVGKEGRLIWPWDKSYDEMALRVEADGYLPQVFNWIEKKKGSQDLFFQMVADRGMNCRVVMEMAEDKPAAGAVIALAMVQREAVIENGKLRLQNATPAGNAADQWRRARTFTADADGRFTLPPENDPTAAVLFIHESGVMEMKLSTFKELVSGLGEQTGYRCKLRPWARVTGKVVWGGKPAVGGQKVSLTIHRNRYEYPGIIAQYETTTTAADGSFVFEKVLPGQVQLSCPITAAAGNKAGITEINLSGRIAHVTLQPGDNPVVIGGGGRTIKGKLTGRDKWDGVTFHFHPTAPHVGFPGDDAMWNAWSEFQKSPEGALYFRNGLKVQADGTFEVTGVMPGDYQIFFKREGEDKYMASGKFNLGAEAAVKDPKAAEDIGEFKAAP